MRTVTGDIWTARTERFLIGASDVPREHWIVVPTNVGWTKDGRNVMGRGIAKEAAERYPELPARYGFWCSKCGPALFIWRDALLLCAPSKPLWREKPSLSWKQSADPKTIFQSYEAVANFARNEGKGDSIHLPLFGAGNGGLSPEVAMAIVNGIDWPENVTLVRKGLK